MGVQLITAYLMIFCGPYSSVVDQKGKMIEDVKHREKRVSCQLPVRKGQTSKSAHEAWVSWVGYVMN